MTMASVKDFVVDGLWAVIVIWGLIVGYSFTPLFWLAERKETR